MGNAEQNVKPLEIATDLTSWYGFLAYLTGELKTPWARDNYFDITVLTLIGTDIRTPLPPVDKSGPGNDLTPLRSHFALASQDISAKENALAYQKDWLSNENNAKSLRAFLNKILDDESCTEWLSWHIHKEWPQHIRRCKGLVEEGNEEFVAFLVDGLASGDIKAINNEALQDPLRFSREAKELHRRLFTADVIIRGLYYQRITELLCRQQVVHQTRRLPLATASEEQQIRISVGYEPFLLAEFIRRDSVFAKSHKEQVEKWIDTVNKAQIVIAQAESTRSNHIEYKDNNEKFLSELASALRISEELNLSTGKKLINSVVEYFGEAIGGAGGAGAGFIIDRLCGTGVIGTMVGAAAGSVFGRAMGAPLESKIKDIANHPKWLARKLSSAVPAMVRSSIEISKPPQ